MKNNKTLFVLSFTGIFKYLIIDLHVRMFRKRVCAGMTRTISVSVSVDVTLPKKKKKKKKRKIVDDE